MSPTDCVSVRPAAQEDQESILALAARQLAEHDVQVPQERLADAIRTVLSDPARGLFLIAHNGARSFGFAYLAFVWSLEHAGWAAWLEELYVLPEERGRGTGEALLRAVLDEARGRGCAAVDLEVDEAHRRAEHLYYRNGFIRLARTRWVKRLVTAHHGDGRVLD